MTQTRDLDWRRKLVFSVDLFRECRTSSVISIRGIILDRTSIVEPADMHVDLHLKSTWDSVGNACCIIFFFHSSDQDDLKALLTVADEVHEGWVNYVYARFDNPHLHDHASYERCSSIPYMQKRLTYDVYPIDLDVIRQYRKSIDTYMSKEGYETWRTELSREDNDCSQVGSDCVYLILSFLFCHAQYTIEKKQEEQSKKQRIE